MGALTGVSVTAARGRTEARTAPSGQAGRPGQPRFMMRAFCRDQSRSFCVFRLSCCRLPFAIPTSLYIGKKQFDRDHFYPGFRSSDWWHNDGLVSVYSQVYPRISGDHPVGGEIGSRTHFRPGEWYHELLNLDHIDIVAIPEPGKIGAQARFYRQLFERLAALP